MARFLSLEMVTDRYDCCLKSRGHAGKRLFLASRCFIWKWWLTNVSTSRKHSWTRSSQQLARNDIGFIGRHSSRRVLYSPDLAKMLRRALNQPDGMETTLVVDEWLETPANGKSRRHNIFNSIVMRYKSTCNRFVWLLASNLLFDDIWILGSCYLLVNVLSLLVVTTEARIIVATFNEDVLLLFGWILFCWHSC